MHVRGEKVVHVTQMRKGSGRHIGEIVIGIALLLLSIVFAGMFVYCLYLPFVAVKPETIFEWIVFIIGYVLLLGLSLGGAVFCFMLGKYQVTIRAKWNFTLFTNEITAHLLDDDTNEMKEFVIPLKRVLRCIIMRREKRETIRLNNRTSYRYNFYLGTHLYYEDNGEEKLISFENPNNLDKLDRVVRYLQDERHIPMYFTHAKDDHYTNLPIAQLIEQNPPESFTLPNKLAQLSKRNYSISVFAEMRRNKGESKDKIEQTDEEVTDRENTK